MNSVQSVGIMAFYTLFAPWGDQSKHYRLFVKIKIICVCLVCKMWLNNLWQVVTVQNKVSWINNHCFRLFVLLILVISMDTWQLTTYFAAHSDCERDFSILKDLIGSVLLTENGMWDGEAFLDVGVCLSKVFNWIQFISILNS